MLTQLSIRNILLLKSCDITFGRGLNVLTGETGAGKSILLDALGLALGERSEAGLVREGAGDASVTAEFEVAGNRAVQALCDELALPFSESLIIRRQVKEDGKSRAFINDEPVSVAGLKRMGELLVARHGQHDSRGLLDAKTHRALLDEAAGNSAQLKQCAAAFAAWKVALSARDALEQQREHAARDAAWLQQTVEELGALDPQAHEESELLELRRRANQSRQAMGGLEQAMSQLSGEEGVSLKLRRAVKSLQKADAEMPGLAAVTEALERAEAEAEEALVGLERIAATFDIDPHALEAAEDRLHALRGAARKFNVPVEMLTDRLQEARARLALVEDAQKGMLEAEGALTKAREAYLAAADALHAARQKAAKTLVKRVEAELAPLKMAACRLRVVQQALPENQWGEAGNEQVSFEAATNAGMPFGVLSKVASGGELSRLLLAMKLVLKSDATPCLIFDEIDSGTGGAVAEAIGVRLKVLAETAQVLVVTHLPQVAALAAHHLLIRKSDRGTAKTEVTSLNAAARKEELARMLSGATITEEARSAAHKLLEATA